MSSTYPLNLFSRSVIVGVSDHPQGADAIPELARTAYADMAAHTWTRDDSPPTMPVHEYNRPVPGGDAFAALWGYSAQGRTMKSAAGAVCYTFTVPADAVDQTTHGACLLESVAIGVCGDRYLDAGAIVAAIPSASSTPPTWAEFLAASLTSDPVCATGDQLDPKGEPLLPNKREGESATVEFAPGSAPLRYLHVAIRLADYLATRGAWIEGGAMLIEGGVSATFSRTVAPDSATADFYPVRVIRSWTPGAVPVYADFETPGAIDLTPLPFSTWFASYRFASNPFLDWSSTPDEVRLNVAAERLAISGAQRFADSVFFNDESHTLIDPYSSQVNFSGSMVAGFAERDITARLVNLEDDKTVKRECATIAYFCVEGDFGRAPFSSVAIPAGIGSTYSPMRVSGYFISTREVFVSTEIGTDRTVGYRPLIPTADAFAVDRVHFGEATRMHVYGTYFVPNALASWEPLAGLGYLGYTTNVYSDFDLLFPPPAPKEVELVPLFSHVVPKGSTEAVFRADRPVSPNGYGTLLIFVSPERDGAEFGEATVSLPTTFLIR